MKPIVITVGEVTLQAELNETPTAQRIWEALPVEGVASVWGDEVYFEIPVADELAADARDEMAIGELGYWPIGRALCIFFGPTPVSVAGEPRAYSPINVVGRTIDDATLLRGVRSGAPVRVIRSLVAR